MALTDLEINALKPDCTAAAAIEAKAENVAVGKVKLENLRGFALAVLAGMFGVMVGTTLLVWLLCTMEFCGVAYLSPLCDADFRGWLRALLHLPRRWQKLREPALRTPDRRREK